MLNVECVLINVFDKNILASHNYCFELCTEQEERTPDELLVKYKTAFQKNEVQIIVDQISGYLVMVENDVTSKVHEIQWTLQHLHKIALKQSPLTQVQHFQC